jgi:predicted  nucleic acid-binding Zn-ribbon protein
MSLVELIRSAYQERVALAPIPRELRDALRAHERIPKFFDALEREIAVLPERFRDRMVIKETVYSLTDTFIMNIRRVADERQLSDLARKAEIDARTEAAKRDELADRMNRGEAVDLSEIV